jgi:upstream activation factor subunit UAF30
MAKRRKRSSARKSSSRRRSGGRKRTAARGGARRRTGARKTAKRGGRKRAAGRSRAKKRTGAKRKPNPAFMKPMTPSSELAEVVGSSPLPRTEITKRLWQYIKRRGLQDKTNRRMINADDNLRPIFGGRRQVSMFDMTRMVNQHLR